MARRKLHKLAATALCGVLLVCFGVWKSNYNPPLGDGLDGAYYLHIARHIAEGRGFVTSLSLYHMGLYPLPQPATTYPLLPWIIGLVSKFVRLASAAAWVPEIAYLLSIALCFVFVLSTLQRSLGRSFAALWVAASVAVWFGLNPVYHWASSRPYTESLGLLLSLLALWSFGIASATPFRSARTRAMSFGAIGLICGLCYVARFQLLALSAGLIAARLLGRRRGRIRDAVSLCAGMLPALGWVAARVLSMPNANLYALADFASYRQLASLPRFDYGVKFDTAFAWLADKVLGLLVAFDPNHSDGYGAQFGWLICVVPISLLLLALRVVKGRSPLASWRGPRHAALWASAWVGLFGVLPIHFIHSEHWRSWAFGWRHGLPLMFVILPTAFWLTARTRRWCMPLLGLLFISSAFVIGPKALNVPERGVPAGFLESYAEVGGYLQKHALHSVTLGMEPQPLSVFTDAPLHWLACWSDPVVALRLVEQRPIQRLVLWPAEIRCPSLDGIRSRLVLERRFETHLPLLLFRLRSNTP